MTGVGSADQIPMLFIEELSRVGFPENLAKMSTFQPVAVANLDAENRFTTQIHACGLLFVSNGTYQWPFERNRDGTFTLSIEASELQAGLSSANTEYTFNRYQSIERSFVRDGSLADAPCELFE